MWLLLSVIWPVIRTICGFIGLQSGLFPVYLFLIGDPVS